MYRKILQIFYVKRFRVETQAYTFEFISAKGIQKLQRISMKPLLQSIRKLILLRVFFLEHEILPQVKKKR